MVVVAYIYNTRIDYTCKRDGTYKERLVFRAVFRGDQQVWDDWESAAVDDEEPGTFLSTM